MFAYCSSGTPNSCLKFVFLGANWILESLSREETRSSQKASPVPKAQHRQCLAHQITGVPWGPGGGTLSNTLSCSEEDAISVVLVKVKPLAMPKNNTDPMLAAYTHWYKRCPVSARTSPTSHTVLLPCGPQVTLGENTREAPSVSRL